MTWRGARRALCGLALTSGLARADGEPRRDFALSLPLVGLLASSVGFQLEQRVAARWSLATSMALRKSGGDDYDVRETGFGVEGRRWLARARGLRALRGPFVAARLEHGVTSASLHGRPIGSTVRVGASGAFGWRWIIAERVEIAPSVGVGVRVELDGRDRVAPWARAEIFRFSTTVGVVF